jgi:predicted fused transcriptional regulator/phosphomethylpyrimidine kinase/predicted transcriptional regulator
MQPPDELMTASFLPGMRHLVARELRSRGLSQNRISALMGVTQASVSLYLSSDSRRAYGLLSKFSLSRRQADEDSTRLADALQRSPVEGLRALNGLWTGILGSGSACEEHRRIYPSLSDCDFCVQAYGGEKGVMAETISEVAEAVSFLEGSPEFVNIMPEVSVNLACAAGEARSPGEVVAIPGRIVKVKDRAKAMLPPEPGASVHMSKILLLVRSRMPETRACINFRFDARIGVLLAGSGLRTLVLRRHPSHPAEDATVESLERKLKATNRPFDAIVDEGGSGIEPNVYLFGTGAGQVARMAIKLAEEYSAG